MTTSLREIPGIGERMETHFRNIGVSCVEELVGRSPEELFELNCKIQGLPRRPVRALRFPSRRLLCGESRARPREAQMVVLEG